MIVDYHSHTVLCHHASGTVDEYLERASELGIDEFGFSEHSTWMKKVNARKLCPSHEEMKTYLGWMDERRAQYDGTGGKLKLRVGLEADWVPDRLDEALEFIASYPFDYVYGSVHHLPDPETGNWVGAWWFETDNLDLMYRTYFAEIEKLAASGMCDILAHIDVIRRSGRVPEIGVLPYVEEILPTLITSGVAVEINTSGKDHLNGDFFPVEPVLKRLVEAKVPITFGSDSHAPSHVGRYFDDAVAFLKKCGGKEFVRFEGRKKIPTPLA